MSAQSERQYPRLDRGDGRPCAGCGIPLVQRPYESAEEFAKRQRCIDCQQKAYRAALAKFPMKAKVYPVREGRQSAKNQAAYRARKAAAARLARVAEAEYALLCQVSSEPSANALRPNDITIRAREQPPAAAVSKAKAILAHPAVLPSGSDDEPPW